MKWTIAMAKGRIKHLPTGQLDRLYRRIWKWIKKESGPGAWDFPTMYGIWPCLACHLMAINELMVERKESSP